MDYTEEQLRELPMNIPNHRHTGIDSPRIFMGDLALDSRGLVFPTSQGNIAFKIFNDEISKQAYFQINPQNNASFIHRFILQSFDSIGIYSGANGVTIDASTPTDPDGYPHAGLEARTINAELYAYNSIGNFSRYIHGVGSLVIDGSDWYMRMPVNSLLPVSPQVGDICFFGTQLQVCETAGVWTAK